MTGNVKLDEIEILIAEDDDDDYFLLKEAVEEARLEYRIHRVKDGEELMGLLRSMGNNKQSLPHLILLDLNLPKKGGREALEEIKANSDLRKIPVIVLTTSGAKEDISFTYDVGVNTFIQKPMRFDHMVEFLKTLETYWFKFVKLPSGQ